MWLTPGRTSGRKKNVAPKLFMMAQLEHGHCTARSTVLAAPPAIWLKSGERGQTAVGLDPINEGVQPDVLQRGRAGLARQRSKSHGVRTATWNVSSMVSRSGEVVDALHRRKIDFCCAHETRWKGGRVRKIDFCCAHETRWKGESARMLGANGR